MSTTQQEAEVLACATPGGGTRNAKMGGGRPASRAAAMPAGRLNSNDSEATEVRTREVGGTNRRGRSQRAAKPQSRIEVEETPPGVRSSAPRGRCRRPPDAEHHAARSRGAGRSHACGSAKQQRQRGDGSANARSRRHKPKGAAPESSQAPEPRRGRGNATGGAILSTKRAVPKATKRRAPLSKKPRRWPKSCLRVG